MLLSSISETTYYEKREKNGTSAGFYSTGSFLPRIWREYSMAEMRRG